LTAGVLGAIAAAARPSGLLVAIPLAAMAARRRGRFWLAPVMTVAATVAVFAFFWERSGVASAFFRAQANWHHHGPTLGLVHELIAYERVDRLTTAATALVAATLLFLAYRRQRHRVAFLIAAYAVCVTYLVLAAPTELLRAERTLAAVVLPIVVVLWLKGARYRVWAVYASAVVGVSLLSGSLQGFGRQALLAFPVFWAVADGPPSLRSRPAAALAIAANLVLLWTLKTFPP
jgi:hypothetical protein